MDSGYVFSCYHVEEKLWGTLVGSRRLGPNWRS